MRNSILIIFISMGISFPLFAQQYQSPYTGQEHRQIKALSESEINSLFSGAGMGFSKAAELNHYPGPKHVLEFSEQLNLTGEQIQNTQASFDKMHTSAVNLGKQIVHSEKELDDLFKSGNFDSNKIVAKVDKIAELNGKLRFVHLNAHLEMKSILSEEQIEQYDQLRGYSHQGSEKMHHQNHHQ